MEPFRKLNVWEKAHVLTIEVYKITEHYPKHELFGIVSQMRRAAVSVTANIVEGVKRKTGRDKKHFLVMADTSLEELKYFFILSEALAYINDEKKETLIERSREVGRMLDALSKSIKS